MECVREAVSCSICFKVFQAGVCDPLSLLCGHTFCRSCLNTVKQTGKFLCPTCRQSHNNVQVEKLPVNYSLLSLSSACPGFMFENCSEHGDNLRYWCSECDLPLCSLCLYSGHPQGHNVKLITAYVQERKVALEAEIKLHQIKITHQQKEVWNRIVKLVSEINELRGNSFTLHNNQLGLNQLLANVRKANSIESIKHAEKRMKEYSPVVIFEKCEAKSSSATENAVNETIKIQSTGQDTERRENTFGVSKRDDADYADASDIAADTDDEYHEYDENDCMEDVQYSLGIGKNAALDFQEGRLLLQCVSHPTDSHIPLQMPSEVFLELSAGDRCFGRVYIRMWCHLLRAQQFMALCLGTLGTSHYGTKASKVINKNSNGETIVFNTMTDVFNELERGANYSKAKEAGHILAHLKERTYYIDEGESSGFSICTRETQDNSKGIPFGKVTSGLDVVKVAAAHNPVTQVKISCCGLVVPEFVL